MEQTSEHDVDEVLAYLQVLKFLEPSEIDMKVSAEGLALFNKWMKHPVIQNALYEDKERGAAIMVFLELSRKYSSGTESKISVHRGSAAIVTLLTEIGVIKEKEE